MHRKNRNVNWRRKKTVLRQPDHSLAINADAGRGRDFEDLRRKVASVGRVCMPTSAVRLRLLSWVRKSPSFYFLERQLLCRGAIMAEVPAEAPAEGEAVAEVKIDSNLSSLRLTFPRKILCQHHAWTSQNSLQRYWISTLQGFALDFLFIKIGELSQTNIQNKLIFTKISNC